MTTNNTIYTKTCSMASYAYQSLCSSVSAVRNWLGRSISFMSNSVTQTISQVYQSVFKTKAPVIETVEPSTEVQEETPAPVKGRGWSFVTPLALTAGTAAVVSAVAYNLFEEKVMAAGIAGGGTTLAVSVGLGLYSYFSQPKKVEEKKEAPAVQVETVVPVKTQPNKSGLLKNLTLGTSAASLIASRFVTGDLQAAALGVAAVGASTVAAGALYSYFSQPKKEVKKEEVPAAV